MEQEGVTRASEGRATAKKTVPKNGITLLFSYARARGGRGGGLDTARKVQIRRREKETLRNDTTTSYRAGTRASPIPK